MLIMVTNWPSVFFWRCTNIYHTTHIQTHTQTCTHTHTFSALRDFTFITFPNSTIKLFRSKSSVFCCRDSWERDTCFFYVAQQFSDKNCTERKIASLKHSDCLTHPRCPCDQLSSFFLIADCKHQVWSGIRSRCGINHLWIDIARWCH